MEVIGYAALQIIPSMKGVSAEINRQLGGIGAAGEQAGNQFGNRFTAGVATSARVAGAALGTVAVATAGLGAKALKAGYDYNTLGQRANAAFRTLLGSQSEATKFMGEIAEFASSSPFPRQAFIEGAQIMKAFGYETEKIIPTLGAVQDAVAASGGSAQQLSEVTFVLAQIQSAGKITAADLMQLGQRGVNAAELIGSQMGKTAAQVKEDISAGALDAGDALDMLAAGMEERFGGAADNVKATWLGATDRVKGAMRDIGSAWVEPFVGFEGGGAAVGWANTVADVFRAFQRGPAKELQPFFESIAAAGDKVMAVFARLGTDDGMAKFVAQVKPMLPVIAGLSAGLASFTAKGVLGAIPGLGPLVAGLNPVVIGIGALVAATPAARDALRDVFDAVAPLAVELVQALLPSLTATSDVAGGVLPTAIRTAGTALEVVLRLTIPVAEAFSHLLEAITPLAPLLAVGAAAWVGYKAAMAGVAAWTAVSAGASGAAAALTGLRTVLAGSIMMYQAAGGGLAGLGAAVTGLATTPVTGMQALGGAFAGVAIGVAGASAVMQRSMENAKASADQFFDDMGVDRWNADSLISGLSEVNRFVQEKADEAVAGGDVRRIWQNLNPFTDNTVQEAINEATAAGEKWASEYQPIVDKALAVALNTGTDMQGALSWMQELNLDPQTGSVEAMSEAITEAMIAARNGTPETDALTAAYEELADQTANSTKQLDAWKQSYDAAVGIQKNAFDAATAQGKAVEDLTKALLDNGFAFDVSSEAGRANRSTFGSLVDSNIELAEAYGRANGGIDAAKLKFAELDTALTNQMRMLGLSESQIQSWRNELGLTPEVVVTLLELDAGQAESQLAGIKGDMAALDGLKVTMYADLKSATNLSDVGVFKNWWPGRQRRWGGIDQAHIGHGDLIRWAEPETGGEAYIPRLGDRGRSEQILSTAAAWYGGQFVPSEVLRRRAWPMAAGGVLHARADTSGGSGVTVQGGITVQTSSNDPYESGRDFARGIADEDWLTGTRR